MKLYRSLVTLLCLYACTLGSAQTTLTTYYVIPPTNGCDGIWAFGPYSSLWSSCSGPYMWLFDPVDCVDSGSGQPVPLNVMGDTIIMDLCSQPCDFLFYSADQGLCAWCICGLLIPTHISGTGSDISFTIGPNPVPINSPFLVLNTADTGLHHVQVMDLAGRSVLFRTVNGGRTELDLHGIPSGGYLLLIRDEVGHLSTQRFQVE